MPALSASDHHEVGREERRSTDQGRELTTLIPHHLASVYNAGLAGFTQEEFVMLKQRLRRIIANRDTST